MATPIETLETLSKWMLFLVKVLICFFVAGLGTIAFAIYNSFDTPMPKNKVFTCTSFTGHWPVGTAAVVLADNTQEAAEALNAELVQNSLPGDVKPEDMQELQGKSVPVVRILHDGQY